MTHYTKGTLSGLMPLQLIVGVRFQVLFHSPRRGAFHLSLTVLVHYRSCTSTQAWRVVPPCSNKISRVPFYSRLPLIFTHTGLSPTMADLSRSFWLFSKWPLPGPRSLVTTNGVSVDVLSSSYLDVSVHQVCFTMLLIHIVMTLQSRVSPFGNLRIKVCSQLPEAFRNVLRPSSPLNAKASTKRPFHTLLNSQTFFIQKRVKY